MSYIFNLNSPERLRHKDMRKSELKKIQSKTQKINIKP
jgi:hypothetical protein